MRRRMKTHPRSRACSCPDTPARGERFDRAIASVRADRSAARRAIAHMALFERAIRRSRRNSRNSRRAKKKEAPIRDAEKRFSRARDRISNAGDSRDRRREVRARSMIDDARVARSRDRSIARARGRPRARGLSEPAGGRAGDDDARGARASASAGASARGGVRCEKIRARRRRGAGGETRSATARGRWRFIHPSRHRAIQTSIAARRARRRAWAWCRDIDRRARRR